jgi:pimeloyl-ACP methyl ester carboxylesterase
VFNGPVFNGFTERRVPTAGAEIFRRLGGSGPLLVLWGGRGVMGGVVGRSYDVLALWRERATEVRGQALDCGHFLPEEAAEETLAALLEFF